MATLSPVKHIVGHGDVKVLTIGPNDSAAVAAEKMTEHDVGCLLVTDEQATVAGILTERDIIAKVVSNSANAHRIPVKDIMTARG